MDGVLEIAQRCSGQLDLVLVLLLVPKGPQFLKDRRHKAEAIRPF